jgi:2-polyprenyl-3-methyl-5-hydroxy-6-metoxy-1,4-benzoquinol methylase
MSDKFVSWEAAVSWLMNQPDKQDLVRDCYYDASVTEAAQRYWKSPEWQAVKAILPINQGYALDLGAGRGIASYSLAKEGWNVLAVEPDSSNLVGAGAIEYLAQSETLPIQVVREFGEKIKCDSVSFDLVFARQVLHHAHDLKQLCAEVYRVLKPGGSFIAIRDHVISSKADLQAFLDIHPLHHLYGGENAYTETDYIAAIKNAGFIVKRVVKSFDSVINYAPYSDESLKIELKNRINKLPVIGIMNCLLNNKWLYKLTLKLLSIFDCRPGRLYSFVCIKPEK